jgi:serine protease inhibitor
LLANSLWLRDDWDYDQDTVSVLSKKYYASVFRGEMGSADCNTVLQNWMNEQTGGLLKDQIDKIETDPSTVLALVSTVWFEAAWEDKFSNIGDQVFHATGGDVQVPFIYNYVVGATYSEGDCFSAVNVSFKESSSITFILPEEGTSPESLLSDPQLLDFMIDPNEWKRKEYVLARLSLPKFDVSSQIDLKDGLKELGITDIFDYGVSDFSPITSESNEIYVDQATHGARVQLDENGCIATAYTIITDGNGSAPKHIEFVVDRPFLFVIYSPSNLPLFVGIVNQP